MSIKVEQRIDKYIKDKNENSIFSTINENFWTDIKWNEDKYSNRQKLYLKENKNIWDWVKLQFLELKLWIFDANFKPFVEELKSLREWIESAKQWDDKNESPDSNTKFDIKDEEFKISTKELYDNIEGDKPSWDSFLPAYLWYKNLSDKVKNKKYLTIVDFSKSRKEKRLYVIDLDNNKIVHHTKVWHGENTWEEYASDFSNQSWSHKSSLWFMLTNSSYEENSKWTWEWLRLYWLEKWINDQTDERGIFMHPSWVKWSEWCLTIPKKYDSRKIMDKVIWKSLIFSYFPDNNYFAQSDVLKKTPNQIDMA